MEVTQMTELARDSPDSVANNPAWIDNKSMKPEHLILDITVEIVENINYYFDHSLEYKNEEEFCNVLISFFQRVANIVADQNSIQQYVLRELRYILY